MKGKQLSMFDDVGLCGDCIYFIKEDDSDEGVCTLRYGVDGVSSVVSKYNGCVNYYKKSLLKSTDGYSAWTPIADESALQDSGERREFETGAVRDMAEGKGRCDLLPACALLRLSKHYEEGAKKYDERNWEKGIPISVMMDSAIRHILKYMDGQTDEDHLVAAAWNIVGAMWMEEKMPEMQDIPSRKEREEL